MLAMRKVGVIHMYRRRKNNPTFEKRLVHAGPTEIKDLPWLALFFFVVLSEQKFQTFSENKRINVVRDIFHKDYGLNYLQTQFAGTRAQKYEENKKMVLSGVKKIDMEMFNLVQDWQHTEAGSSLRQILGNPRKQM